MTDQKGRIKVIPKGPYRVSGNIPLYKWKIVAGDTANISLVAFGRALDSPDGQVLVFFALAVAAAEVSVGLAIIIDLFRKKGTVDINQVSLLKG